MIDSNISIRNKFEKAWETYNSFAIDLGQECQELLSQLEDNDEVFLDYFHDFNNIKDEFNNHLYFLESNLIRIENSMEELKDIKYLENSIDEEINECKECIHIYENLINEIKTHI